MLDHRSNTVVYSHQLQYMYSLETIRKQVRLQRQQYTPFYHCATLNDCVIGVSLCIYSWNAHLDVLAATSLLGTLL